MRGNSQVPPASGTNEHRVGYVLTHLGQVNGWTLAIGAGVLTVMFVSARLNRRIPGALIGLVVSPLVPIYHWYV